MDKNEIQSRIRYMRRRLRYSAECLDELEEVLQSCNDLSPCAENFDNRAAVIGKRTELKEIRKEFNNAFKQLNWLLDAALYPSA